MIEAVKQNPLILPLRKLLYERKFALHTNVHYFRGVFATFEEAAASAPKTKPIGYDNDASALMYKERCERLYQTDYPILFWLEKLRSEVRRVFDFGGHIGVHFYAYPKVLAFESITEWMVCDVEAVCHEGRKFASSQRVAKLNFVNDISSCEGYDLLLANGSLQYLEWELHQKLKALKRKPRYVIFNATPLHPTMKTITLNNIGTSFCPYHIRREQDFIQGLESAGYELLDRWRHEDKACRIAFERERSLHYYTGGILKLKGSP